jgi:chaperonin GroEL (HSP60 family)
VVLRGSTDSILDDLERAVDDGVNTYKVIFVEYSKSVFSDRLVMICLYEYGWIVVLLKFV